MVSCSTSLSFALCDRSNKYLPHCQKSHKKKKVSTQFLYCSLTIKPMNHKLICSCCFIEPNNRPIKIFSAIPYLSLSGSTLCSIQMTNLVNPAFFIFNTLELFLVCRLYTVVTTCCILKLWREDIFTHIISCSHSGSHSNFPYSDTHTHSTANFIESQIHLLCDLHAAFEPTVPILQANHSNYWTRVMSSLKCPASQRPASTFHIISFPVSKNSPTDFH